MRIDNFNLLKPCMDFSDKDKFYYLQIIQRKKDRVQSKSHCSVVKNFYIKSEDYLNKKEEEIKDYCVFFNARAYLRLNRRSWYDVSMKSMELAGKYVYNKDYESFKSLFSKSCGQTCAEPRRTKTWIVDIDTMCLMEISNKIKYINKLHKENGGKIICSVPTRNGCHIITNPFDSLKFKKEFPDIDIHKDNPTILYMP